jgi:hypothetical protein
VPAQAKKSEELSDVEETHHCFQFRNDEFLEHYHKRSNPEMTFNVIKSKFGDAVRSKTEVAQINEARLCELESQIAELKSLLLKNGNQKAPQSPLFRQSTPKKWARPDSNQRPPPCQGGGFRGF